MKKGDYGYLKNRKTSALVGVFAMLAFGLTIFFIGLLLNKMSHRNIFSVIAVLFVLPGTKFLIRFIVTFPFGPVDKQTYENAKKHTAEKMELYTDMLITSPEKVMYLKFIAVGSNHVIALLGNDKQDIGYIRKYLSDGINYWGNGYNVKILEDEESFFKEIDSVTVQDVNYDEEQSVKAYLLSLVV